MALESDIHHHERPRFSSPSLGRYRVALLLGAAGMALITDHPVAHAQTAPGDMDIDLGERRGHTTTPVERGSRGVDPTQFTFQRPRGLYNSGPNGSEMKGYQSLDFTPEQRRTMADAIAPYVIRQVALKHRAIGEASLLAHHVSFEVLVGTQKITIPEGIGTSLEQAMTRAILLAMDPLRQLSARLAREEREAEAAMAAAAMEPEPIEEPPADVPAAPPAAPAPSAAAAEKPLLSCAPKKSAELVSLTIQPPTCESADPYPGFNVFSDLTEDLLRTIGIGRVEVAVTYYDYGGKEGKGVFLQVRIDGGEWLQAEADDKGGYMAALRRAFEAIKKTVKKGKRK